MFPHQRPDIPDLAMVSSSIVYVAVSLLGKKHVFSMDRMPHRGQCTVPEDVQQGDQQPVTGWRVLCTREATARRCKFMN